MAKVLFSTWGGEFIDNRGKPSSEWSDSGFKVPDTYEGDRSSKAFIGWDGVAIFTEDIDAVILATQYAAQYQIYSEACGRCAPGDGVDEFFTICLIRLQEEKEVIVMLNI